MDDGTAEINYEGQRIDTNNHQLKLVRVKLVSAENKVKVLESQIEEITKSYERQLEALRNKLKYSSKNKMQPKARKNKPMVETTGEEPQGQPEETPVMDDLNII